MQYNEKEEGIKSVRKYSNRIITITIFLIVGSLIWNFYDRVEHTQILINNIVTAEFNKDQAVRFWTSIHGGVYLTKEQQKKMHNNSFVISIDTVDYSKDSLTLLNIAYLTKQMFDEYLEVSDTDENIIDEVVINSFDIKEDWEDLAISAFRKGENVKEEKIFINEEEHLRLIKPMFAEKSCFKCHSKNDFEPRELIGGVGVLISLKEYNSDMRNDLIAIVLIHLGLIVLSFISVNLFKNRLITSIEEQIKSDKKLKQAESLYRTVSQYTYNWEYWISPTGEAIFVSPACEKISGYTVEDFMEDKDLLTKITIQDDKEIWCQHLIATEKRVPDVRELSFRIKHKDGSVKWIGHICRPIIDDSGEFLGYRATNRDITDQILNEIELKKALSENEKRIEELKKLNTKIEEEQAAALNLMEDLQIEVSERIEKEKDLAESEKKYRDLSQLFISMSDNLTDMLWAKDLDNKYIFANKTICKKLLNAIDTNEPLGKNDMFFAKRERESQKENENYHTFGELCMNSDDVVLKNKESGQFDEWGNVKGEFLYLDVYKAPLYNENGELIGTVGSARDVTKEKEIINKLNESEAENRAIVEAIPDLLLELDKNAIIKSFHSTNKATPFALNEELLETNFGLTIGKNFNRRLIENISNVVLNDQLIEWEFSYPFNNMIFFFEMRIVKKDDETVIAFIRDITEKKEIELKLINSEKKFRRVLENIPLIGVILDDDSNIVYSNNYLCEFTGWGYNEIIGKNWLEIFIQDKDKTEIQKKIDQIIDNKKYSDKNTNEIILKNGDIKIISWSNSILEIGGEKAQIASIGRDITEEYIERIFSQKLIEFYEQIKSKDNLEDILKIILFNSQDIVGMEDGGIYLYDDEKNGLYLYVSEGINEETYDKIKFFPKEHPIFADVYTNQLPIFKDFEIIKKQYYDFEKNENLKSEIFIPIFNGEQLVSVIVLVSRVVESFGEIQMKLVNKLSNEISKLLISAISEIKITENRKRYETLFNSMLNGFALHEMIFDEKGEPCNYKFLDVNPAFERLTGLKKDVVLNKTVLEFMPDLEKHWLEVYGDIVKTGTPQTFENYSHALNKYFEVMAYTPQEGQFATIIQDSSEKMIAQEHLKKLSRAVEQSPVSIVITSVDGIIEYVNPKFCDTTGYSDNELIGNTPKILKSGEHDSMFYKDMWNTLLNGNEWNGIFLNKIKDGSLIYESTIISPVKNSSQEITHFVAVKENITERVKTERELKNYQESLENLVEKRTAELVKTNNLLEAEIQKSRYAEQQALTSLEKQLELSDMKSKFISTTSHEFKTPLTTILSSVELMEVFVEKHQFEKTYKHVDRIKRSIEFLNNLINDILLLNKTETGNIEYNPEQLNIRILSEEILSDLMVANKGKHKFVFNNNLFNKEIFLLDKRLTTLIISNLLSNAIKYSPNGGDIILKLHFNMETDNLEIEVADKGIGISEEDIKYVFQQFYRGENIQNISGSGLGLSIVKKAIDLQNGSITLKSKIGEGSKFTVKLPGRGNNEKNIIS